MSGASLEGRKVLITGAGSGIGRALAASALSAGADVTGIDLDAASLRDGVEAGCAAQVMDVADPEAWDTLPRTASGWSLVALNAGIMTAPPEAPPEESDLLTMDLRRYRRIMSVNVDGVVLGVRRLLPELAAGGAIVVTASAAGLVGFGQDVPYAMTKHAVVGLVRSVAQQIGDRPGKPRICAVCPGGVRTAIVPSAFRETPMMDPSVIGEEILDLWRHGENGEVRVKMRPELPGQHVDEPKLPAWR